MGPINVIKPLHCPLNTKQCSAVDESLRHREILNSVRNKIFRTNLRECGESNPGQLGEKRERYLCAMPPPLWWSKFVVTFCALFFLTQAFSFYYGHLRNKMFQEFVSQPAVLLHSRPTFFFIAFSHDIPGLELIGSGFIALNKCLFEGLAS